MKNSNSKTKHCRFYRQMLEALQPTLSEMSNQINVNLLLAQDTTCVNSTYLQALPQQCSVEYQR